MGKANRNSNKALVKVREVAGSTVVMLTRGVLNAANIDAGDFVLVEGASEGVIVIRDIDKASVPLPPAPETPDGPSEYR